MLELLNLDNGEVVACRLRLARNFAQRLKGLMFSKCLPPGSGLHIQPCRSIHTFFMNYPIDVLYLNEQLYVVGLERQLQPGRVGLRIEGTVSVAELPPGTIERTRTEIGQKLHIY